MSKRRRLKPPPPKSYRLHMGRFGWLIEMGDGRAVRTMASLITSAIRKSEKFAKGSAISVRSSSVTNPDNVGWANKREGTEQ